MEPSSLVLVAIIGVWAAYLVPHWVRRRDELAQSRTPDRFSDGLRVLQRRRRRGRSSQRSGDAVLTSPRVVVDVDGELLYVPGARAGKRAGAVSEPVAQPAEPVTVAAAEKAPVPVSAASASRPMVRPAYHSPAATAKAVAAEAVSEPVEVAKDRPARRPRDFAAALAGARSAARRRAVILLGLAVVTVAAGVSVPVLTAPVWVVAPSGVLLLLHLMASRVAAIRSTEQLAVLREQARPVPAARPRPVVARPVVAAAHAAAAPAPVAAPDRVARRAIAVGAETWEPIPVPVPTYTLKPAVFRPEPPPLDLPAASTTDRPRGALPRRAEEIERILAMDADPVLDLQELKAVNG